MCGVQRRLKSLSRASAHRFENRNPWGNDIESAAAELAVAKALGLYWDASIDVFGRPDLVCESRGVAVEVKLNSARDDGDLMVLASSPIEPETIFVLVTGALPAFRIVGWTRGEYVKTFGERRTMAAGHENFIVPQSMLNHFRIPMKGTFDDDFPF